MSFDIQEIIKKAETPVHTFATMFAIKGETCGQTSIIDHF